MSTAVKTDPQASTPGGRPASRAPLPGGPLPQGTPPVPEWKARAAGVVATLTQLGALISLLLVYNIGAHGWVGYAVYLVFTVFALPVDSSLFIALVLAVLGLALRRRKRAALNVLLVFQAVAVLVMIAMNVAVEFFGKDIPLVENERPVPEEQAWALLGLTGAVIAVFVFLYALRPAFPARLARGAFLRATGTAIGGLVLTSLVGWGLTELFPGTLVATADKAAWAANQVTGRILNLRHIGVAHHGPNWLSVLLGFLGAVVAGYALLMFFRSVRNRRLMSPTEELRIRELLAEHGEDDSLGYFATRRDKSVSFAPNGKAAVTYRVLGGTSLVSGDPIGAPDAWAEAIRSWLTETADYGWVPAVLGASERGAQAYTAAGLKALELGDEAIVDVREFGLAGRDRRAVRQAVNRLERAGYRTQIRPHGDIPRAEMDDLLARADAWRNDATERGFSMALSRLGDPSDERCVMVEAYDRTGALRGLLNFVPWGQAGLSLDLMRRDRAAENGLNEYMVAELVAAAGQLGVRRISLNFAMFRSVFEEGEKIGAGPVLKLWRAILGFFSRFFQLESLYRSNAKYLPQWEPRYMCFQRTGHLPRTALIAGMVEGFVPTRLVDGQGRKSFSSNTMPPDFVARVHEINRRAARPPSARRRVPEQVRVRLAKVDTLRAHGVDPYPVGIERGQSLAAVRDRFGDLSPDRHTGADVAVAGRVVGKREIGGLCFAVLRDFSGELQVMLTADRLGADALDAWKHAIDLGDQMRVTGEVITSRRGELSVLADRWTITAKCLHPLPDKRKGLTDPEARVRQRYLDLVVHPESRDLLTQRSRIVRTVRDFLQEQEYLEVETPMLQTVHGGANARPFVTHINAYDMRMYLRIAPELYLKRLCVAGVDRVFELNRNFRNEGVDATHNPEFTMLEAYQAYADYRTMLELIRQLIQRSATEIYGRPIARRPDGKGGTTEHDLSGEWPIVPIHHGVSAALGEEITPDTPLDVLRRHCQRAGVQVQADWEHGKQVVAAHEHLVEPNTVEPTFFIDYPAETSPLTRPHRDDPRLAERWDLIAFGAEVGTAYSELTDPIEQRRRLEAQSLRAASGDIEAMELDEDFLLALEHGMPPTGGLGMGIDRLVMMLTGTSIRQTIPFPFVRPQ